MKTMLAAGLAGVAMLGGAELADAETTVSADGSIPPTSDASKVALTGPMVLTDGQMAGLTAGHAVRGPFGWIKIKHFHWKGWRITCNPVCIKVPRGYWHNP